MKLDDYRIIFFAIGIIGVLLMASPALSEIIKPVQGESFSELYILDSMRKIDDYPYNIELGENYSVYIGVGNHEGHSAYYTLYLKLLNQFDKLPDAKANMPSPLKAIYEYSFAVANNQTWENLLSFSIAQGSITTNEAIINNMNIDDELVTINKSASWDLNSSSYPYKLLLELWIYNSQSKVLDYSNRYVYLNLNFTGLA